MKLQHDNALRIWVRMAATRKHLLEFVSIGSITDEGEKQERMRQVEEKINQTDREMFDRIHAYRQKLGVLPDASPEEELALVYDLLIALEEPE